MNVMTAPKLSTDQEKAFDLLKNFINNKDEFEAFVLKGYAGTGKTFLIKAFIDWYRSLNPYRSIAVTAPTNKAVKVLRKNSEERSPQLAFKTIHSLLGLKEEIRSNGTIRFAKSSMDKNEIGKYSVLIIDEVSMIPDDIFKEVMTHKKDIRIIFVGDPAQIPPVNNDDCIPFKETSMFFTEFILTEIIRQKAGNPIIDVASALRSNLHGTTELLIPKTEEFEQGVKQVTGSALPLFAEYFNCEAFKADPDHAKVIAWRNATVANVNTAIRHIIYGPEVGRIAIGEKLIANTPIMKGFDTILFTTNDEFEVESFLVKSENFYGPTLKFYDTTVKFTTEIGVTGKKNIMILHEDSFEAFNFELDNLKNKAIMLSGKEKSWYKYYSFLRTFANVGYNYALTAHKAQGSTYKNTFVVVSDIDANKNVYQRNRIKYTAFTRPTDKLFLING